MYIVYLCYVYMFNIQLKKIHKSIYLYKIYPYIYMSIYLYKIYPYIYISVFLSIYLHIYIYISIYLCEGTATALQRQRPLDIIQQRRTQVQTTTYDILERQYFMHSLYTFYS